MDNNKNKNNQMPTEMPSPNVGSVDINKINNNIINNNDNDANNINKNIINNKNNNNIKQIENNNIKPTENNPKNNNNNNNISCNEQKNENENKNNTNTDDNNTKHKIDNNNNPENKTDNENKNNNNNNNIKNIKTNTNSEDIIMQDINKNNKNKNDTNSEDIIMKNTNNINQIKNEIITNNKIKMEIDNNNSNNEIKNNSNNSNINIKRENNINKQLQTQQTLCTTDNNNNDNDDEYSYDDEDDEIIIDKKTYKYKTKRKKNKRCAALDYLSDSPKKKRGRKVKNKKNLPPIQKQPFFLVFPDLRLKCPQCDHIAICQGTLVQHLRTHPTSRKCPECNKTFSTQQNLIKHARLHTGERPYPCPIAKCKWAYKQKGDLLAHIQRGKHGTSSDNNRKPPPQKFYHGSTKLPTLHAISQKDVLAAPDLKQLIVCLRKREEIKKKQKEKVKQKRKNQLDDFVLSMFLSIYDIDNHEMKNLLKIAKTKYKEKMLKKQIIKNNNNNNNNINNNNNNNNNESSDNTQSECEDDMTDIVLKQESNIKQEPDIYLKMDTLPNGNKVSIKFKYLVNRVYGDYSIVLVPVNSVPHDQIYESTPEIVIDPKLIPALWNDNDINNKNNRVNKQEILNEILTDSNNNSIAPPVKKQKLNNGNSNNITKELSDNHIVLGKGNGLLGRAIGHMPRKRQYHKYNQTSEGYWQCDAPNCGSLFLTKELLEFHCKGLHDSGYYGCKYCERIYRSQKNVQNHLKKAHEKHGDEYLNALIYNKFNQIIKIKTSVWNSVNDKKIINKKNKTKNENDKNNNNENNRKESTLTLPLQLPDINTFDNDDIIVKSVIFKTHDINNTILRFEHDSEKEGDDNNKIKLVAWTMQDKNKKSGRGRGRPKVIKDENSNNTTPKKGAPKKTGRPRGRPKGSKNKKKTKQNIVKKPGKRRGPGRPKGSTNKKRRGPGRPRKKEISISSSDSNSWDSSEFDSITDYEIGTIYDDLNVNVNTIRSGNDSDISVMKDEKSILAKDIKLDKRVREYSDKKNKRRLRRLKRNNIKRGRKRKRNEMSSGESNNDSAEDSDSEDNDYIMKKDREVIRVKIEPSLRVKCEKNLNSITNLPYSDIGHITNLGNASGMTFSNINLPSIQNLFSTPQPQQINGLDIPMPAMPSINATTAEFNNLINQIQNAAPSTINNTNGRGGTTAGGLLNDVDMNSIIESLFSSSSQRQSTGDSNNTNNNTNNNQLSPLNSIGSLGGINTLNSMNQLSQLSVVSNQLNNIQNSVMNQRQRQNAMNIQAFNNLLQTNTNTQNTNSSTHSSEEPIHPISKHNNNNNNNNDSLRNLLVNNGGMLNNYGNIVNNNYLLKQLNNNSNINTLSLSQKSNSNEKKDIKDIKDINVNKDENNNNNNNNNKNDINIDNKDDSESPFVPPLVEAVCGATGCIKTKRDDGKPLLMCGRCFNIKYCSKRCQLAHIHDHRQICKKKGAHINK